MLQGPPPTHPDDSSAELTGWSPGARVGEHVLETRLGSGGMGVVFLARHVATGALHVLKVLTVDAPELRARFRREAEALSRVDGHPHVARVHSAGEHRGRPYLVIEHLAGGDLEQRLRRGPLPVTEAVGVVLAVCDGLAHVHAQGVLHRDLKPANVLFDERGCPKLVDFGLARGPNDGALTRTGEVVGTPSYMAPEQADGRSELQDERTDVYGVGAVLYHALAGRPPFEGTSLFAVLEQVLRTTPAPPSALAPGVPAALDAVCLRALAKRPEERFPDVRSLARALSSAPLEGAAPAPTRSRARALVAGGAAALATVTLAALALTRSPSPPTTTTPTTTAVAPPRPAVASTEPAPVTSRRRAPDPSGRPTTIEEIPDPPRSLPERFLAELPGLRFFELERLGDPASGVALSVGRELQRADPALAARYLRWAAERSPDPAVAGRAWLELSELFDDGAGVAESAEQRIECKRRAAATGHADGLLEVGDAYLGGEWGLAPDLEAAVGLFRRALEAPSDDPVGSRAEAVIQLAKAALERPDLVDPAEAELLARGVDRTEARVLEARFLEARGERGEALEVYDDLVRRRDHPEAYLQRARLLLADAPERADELLAGPADPQLRVQFAARLWGDFEHLPDARPRAVAILREVLAQGGRPAVVAGYHLARIRRRELERGVSPPSLTGSEARRLLVLAAADPLLREDANHELARWRE